MRLAISNIAWDVAYDGQVVDLLHKYAIDAIDVAPGKYFPVPQQAQDSEIARVREWWAGRGIEVTGMQALLFGTTGLNLFGAREVQAAMLQHLAAVCRIGSGLGATRLVFGSPKNRDRTGLSDTQAEEAAIDFFRRLGEIAQSHGVTICLEPNPASYQCNFMTDTVATARIVEQVAHPAVRLQLDTGAMVINREDPQAMVSRHAHLVGHIHASEPDLIPLGDTTTDHAQIARALYVTLPRHIVSIEMLSPKNASPLPAIERAIGVAVRNYGAREQVQGDSL